MVSKALEYARTAFIAALIHDPNYKSRFPNPIFEITGIRRIKQDGGILYRIKLSDGRHWMWGILVPELHHMVDDGKIKYQAFVKLNSYDLRIYNGKLFIAMEDLETAPPMWSMAGRVMLGDTGDMDNLTSADFLVVVLGKRYDPMKGKQDYYLWDSSSPIINGRFRKTVLSVFGRLRNDFQPKPGTIVALRELTKIERYDLSPEDPCRVGDKNFGHLNAWPSVFPQGCLPWFLIDPTHLEGYNELKEAWEEQKYSTHWGVAIQQQISKTISSE